MKLTITTVLLIIFFLTANVLAQGNTLIGNNISSARIFGGPIVKYTNINKNGSVMLGVKGGYIINKSFSVGIGMYGLISGISPVVEKIDKQIILDEKPHLMYGGVEFGYIFEPLELLHFSFAALFGLGNLSYNNSEPDLIAGGHHNGESFFVIEPNAGLELNVTSFMKVQTSISYRFSTNIDYPYFINNNIAGFGSMLMLKFGQF